MKKCLIINLVLATCIIRASYTPERIINIMEQDLSILLDKVVQVQDAEIQKHVFSLSSKLGDYYFNERYDYATALKWYSHAISINEDLLSSEYFDDLARLYALLAMIYHNVGPYDKRDYCMNKVRQLLHIPDDLLLYVPSNYKPGAAAYFIVQGYIHYIEYEESARQSVSCEKQTECLKRAEQAFQKAIDIAQKFDLSTQRATALHGLGTVYEFFSKISKMQMQEEQMRVLLNASITFFEQALEARQHILGMGHPHVARSHHKLARNYAAMGDMLYKDDMQEAKTLYRKAMHHYTQALDIFNQLQIPLEQIKRAELEHECKLFQERLPALLG